MLKDFAESAILKQPDSAAIMVGDFNKARLSTSSLYQYVRKDHAAVQLVPIYHMWHKLKNNIKISKQIIGNEAVDKRKAVFDTSDWSLFISDDLCLTTETITDYINFTLTSNSRCEEFIINPNQRPWIKSELKAEIKDNRSMIIGSVEIMH